MPMLNNVTDVYVFRDDHLSLDKHLVCSFQGKTSPTLTLLSCYSSLYMVETSSAVSSSVQHVC